MEINCRNSNWQAIYICSPGRIKPCTPVGYLSAPHLLINTKYLPYYDWNSSRKHEIITSIFHTISFFAREFSICATLANNTQPPSTTTTWHEHHRALQRVLPSLRPIFNEGRSCLARSSLHLALGVILRDDCCDWASLCASSFPSRHELEGGSPPPRVVMHVSFSCCTCKWLLWCSLHNISREEAKVEDALVSLHNPNMQRNMHPFPKRFRTSKAELSRVELDGMNEWGIVIRSHHHHIHLSSPLQLPCSLLHRRLFFIVHHRHCRTCNKKSSTPNVARQDQGNGKRRWVGTGWTSLLRKLSCDTRSSTQSINVNGGVLGNEKWTIHGDTV